MAQAAWHKRGAITALLLAQAACAPTQSPLARPNVPAPLPSAQSTELAAYYAGVQQSLLSQGLLRTDGGGVDTPFTAEMLTTNFLKIALYEEHGFAGRGGAALRLTRWTGPLRVGLHFGAAVAQDRQNTDRARIASYLERLSNLTGLPMSVVSSGANVTIAITNADERRALGPLIQQSLPQVSTAQVAGVTGLDQRTYCLVLTQSEAATSTYRSAFVYIPAEHPDLMRLACIHEEIAQALGLPNDVGTARPSIFNDDEEFALLTRQDEAMLRILYNPALQNGMTEAEARPIVLGLARAMLGGNS
ncbi:MAG: DUF2927 domain-containing protein [Cypionkella sp.]|nr:DUF2927 domain-containing protein [Cypionkella sp.]